MAKGFFKSSQIRSKKVSQTKNSIAHCGACKLYKNCKSPKMEPVGRGEIKILHVAEAPGKNEDLKGEQLIGKAGQFYSKILRNLGIELNAGLKTNAVNCRPPKNRKPKTKEIDACRAKLLKTIDEFKPHVIIALGDCAVESLIKPRFQEKVGGITKWRGAVIPDREFNAWICPTFHPSYVTRDSSPDVVERLFKDDLAHAIKMLDVPLPSFDKDEESKIEIIKHPDEATKWIRDLFNKNIKLTAFDYETTGLKPQRTEQEIKTCAISYGPDHAAAFPMFMDDFEFVDALTHYLSTPRIKKICANMKYERDWTHVKVYVPLNGLFYDTTIGGHFIDNRPGITSLDHQNYIYFGLPPYDRHLKKHLKNSVGGNDLNDIDEIDLREILIYNGMDSMTEFRLGLVQMDHIGLDYSHLYDGKRGFDFCPQVKLLHEKKRTKTKRKKK